MKLSDVKSIEKATDRELLLMVLSMQVQIARRLEFIEAKVGGQKFEGVEDLTNDLVDKLDTFISHLNTSIKEANN